MVPLCFSSLFLLFSLVLYDLMNTEFELTLLEQVLFEVVHIVAHVTNATGHQTLQEWSVLLQLFVIWVVVPSLDGYSIIGLALEVFFNIIDNDDFLHISSQFGQIFDIHSVLEASMITVETVGDEALFVQVVNDPVCILFETCSENCDLKVF